MHTRLAARLDPDGCASVIFNNCDGNKPTLLAKSPIVAAVNTTLAKLRFAW
jgi:hypothetical protein